MSQIYKSTERGFASVTHTTDGVVSKHKKGVKQSLVKKIVKGSFINDLTPLEDVLLLLLFPTPFTRI